MIRPITFICFVLACASGLYLYQSKHRVRVLDRQIEDTIRATEQLREQTRVLHAEWTLQNDPQRLQALADQFLNLKPMAPGQFTSLAELDSRLPAVTPPPSAAPDTSEPASVPVAQAPEAAPPAAPPPAPVVAAAKPAPAAPPPPPKPVAVAAAVPVPRPPEQRLPEHKPQAPAPPRRVLAEVQPALRAPRPIVASVAPQPAASEYVPPPLTGSALGMAHTFTAPPPRPMPVSASQWVTNGNGGG